VKRRSIWVIAGVVAVVVVVVLVLLFLPLEQSTFTQSISTRGCPGLSPCSTEALEYSVGDGRYATLTGNWLTNASGSDVVITVNNGASTQACALCSNLLYSSAGSTLPTGSFDVSGFGPFHISVNQIGSSAQTTVVSGTLDSSVA
jgi:hypothetical protein